MTARHLYVHVPFCARRCAYCDFAIAVRKAVPVDEYLRSLRLELVNSTTLRGMSPRPQLETVYFGGGTPSLLGARGLSDVLGLVREFFDTAPDAEITAEANPDDISAESAEAWLAAGINRLSIGLQTFDDAVLRWMHRTHTAEQGIAAVRTARAAGFANLSVDLIFALPASLSRSWLSDLRMALDLSPDHISLYGLTIEPHTAIARWHDRGALVPAAEDVYADEFLQADEMAAARGYVHYEVSNFARPGKQSRHNSAYWSGNSYLGAGPSAHSFDGETRSWNVAAYAEWVDRLAGGRSIVAGSERLSPANRSAERVYLGLRTSHGLRTSRRDLETARQWTNAGWATIDSDVVRLTPEGWLRLDALAAGLTGSEILAT